MNQSCNQINYCYEGNNCNCANNECLERQCCKCGDFCRLIYVADLFINAVVDIVLNIYLINIIIVLMNNNAIILTIKQMLQFATKKKVVTKRKTALNQKTVVNKRSVIKIKQ